MFFKQGWIGKPVAQKGFPYVTIQYNAKNERKPPYCNYSAVPKMQARGLRSVRPAHEQADDTADGVLLDSYDFLRRHQLLAVISHTPQGQTAAQNPQPIQRSAMTVYSNSPFAVSMRLIAP